MTVTKMTRKGQITIPADIRSELGFSEGDYLVVKVENGRAIVESQRDIIMRTAGALAKYAKHPPLEPSEERRLFEEGVAAEVAASMAAEDE
jgi:AbrB family looped-hinge helix DNA binding protein